MLGRREAGGDLAGLSFRPDSGQGGVELEMWPLPPQPFTMSLWPLRRSRAKVAKRPLRKIKRTEVRAKLPLTIPELLNDSEASFGG